MKKVQLVCLALSNKEGEFCFAGVELGAHRWIRPVSESEHGELSAAQCQLAGGVSPVVLDVIEMPIVEARPEPSQPENCLIGPGPWRRIKHLRREDAIALLSRLATDGPELFGDLADRIPAGQFARKPASSSLIVAEPDDLAFAVTWSVGQFKQSRCRFSLSGQSYDLSLTDAVWRNKLRKFKIGEYAAESLGIPKGSRTFLTLGLGAPWHGHCFKLAVALMPL